MLNDANQDKLQQARVGVIGSGLYAIEGLTDVTEVEVKTPFGTPSDAFRIGRLHGVDVVFLARHGRHHHLLPQRSSLPRQSLGHALPWGALADLGLRRRLPSGAPQTERHGGA